MKVICIDDEYLILQRTVSILRRFEQVESVEGFLSGEDALEYLKNNTADAAFLDINMPDINGLELAKMMRERCENIELVFLTGYNEFALDAFKVHASGYLIKPVEENNLLEEISKEYILTENRSRTTMENMKFSKEHVDQYKADAKIAFSTTNYHVFRSGMLDEQVRVNVEGIGARTKWYFWPNAMLREVSGVFARQSAVQWLFAVGLVLLAGLAQYGYTLIF